MACDDEVCNDDLHIGQEMVNARDARFLSQQTYAINTPNGVGDGLPTAPDPRGDPIPIDGIGPDSLPTCNGRTNEDNKLCEYYKKRTIERK
jgi:hypothetical protein